MKQLLTASLIAISLMIVSSAPAKAENSQEQELGQWGYAECDKGPYGTCKVELEQYANQRQVLGVQNVPEHIPVDTALDTKTMAVLAGIGAIGLAAFVANKRIA